MLYLVALIFPGLAMILAGKPGQGLFCILLQLTLIGWLPATIWALMTVSDSKADRRAKKYAVAAGNAAAAAVPAPAMAMASTATLAPNRGVTVDAQGWAVGPGGVPMKPVDVVGESNYQPALSQLARGNQLVSVTAELRREPNNKYDTNAVQVIVARQLVGYLPRELAAGWSPALEKFRKAFTCPGELRGGPNAIGVRIYLPDLE